MKEKMTYYQAVREALYDELENDDKVVLFGEDIRYNLYAYTYGLMDSFGKDRVIDVPLSEAAVMGTAIGAAMCGIRPVVDLTVSSFLYVAMDQIANMAAKTIYQYNGNYKIPLTIMASSAYGNSAGAQHSDRLHNLLMTIPGLKIITPSSPQDMYSLLREAIRDDSPVVCFQDKNCFYNEGDVDRCIKIPLGKANIVKSGDSISVICIQNTSNLAFEVAVELEQSGLSCEVIDVRSLVPFDYETIFDSVKKTGRVVVVDPANRSCSAAGHISSLISDKLFDYLKKPIRIVTSEDVPLPYAMELEYSLIPTKEKIREAVLSII